MTEQNPPSGRVVLFGATGYTGELAARAMAKRGMQPVLAGRRREAVEALASELGGLEATTADVADPATVRALVERGDVLVSTVGPVRALGRCRPGRRDRRRRPLRGLDRRAAVRSQGLRAGRAACGKGRLLLLTAMGYDWLPGNLTGGAAP